MCICMCICTDINIYQGRRAPCMHISARDVDGAGLRCKRPCIRIPNADVEMYTYI